MKMKLPPTRSVVEIVVTLSILISLVIVIIELSATQKAIRTAAASEVALSLSAWYTDVGLEGVGGSVFRKGMRDPESLTEEKLADFVYLMHGAMLLYQNAFVLGQESTSDNSLNTLTVSTLSVVSDQPGFRMYWRQRKSVFVRSFRDYVEELEIQNDSKLSELYD